MDRGHRGRNARALRSRDRSARDAEPRGARARRAGAALEGERPLPGARAGVRSPASPPLSCPRAAGPPNVVLLTIDTLRADHLSGAGYARATSPHLDAFAATAWRFPDAVTPVPETG